MWSFSTSAVNCSLWWRPLVFEYLAYACMGGVEYEEDVVYILAIIYDLVFACQEW